MVFCTAAASAQERKNVFGLDLVGQTGIIGVIYERDVTDRVGIGLRTLADLEVLQSVVAHQRELTIVGGGFIGLEVAAALARRVLPPMPSLRRSDLRKGPWPVMWS